MEPYNTSISDVLQSKVFLARHPGSSTLGSDVYSSAVNAVSEIVERQRYCGQYVYPATSLAFGSQSAFTITPGSIMNGIVISGSVVLPQHTLAPDLWALNAIDTLEMVISGSSSVQSLKIQGRSMFDFLMASLCSEKIEALKKANPYINLAAVAGNSTIYFTIPLYLFFSSPEIMAVFPLDTSTMQSNILINIKWKANYNIFSGYTGNAVTLPSGFNNLYMRVADQLLINNNFQLANHLRRDPELVYSVPSLYLQSFEKVMNVSSLSTEHSVELTSQPAGQLQALLVSAREVALEGLSTTLGQIQPYAEFASIRVLYNGIELYRADSPNELSLFNSIMTDQDNGAQLQWKGYQTAAGGTPILYDSQPVIIIPFSNEVSKILRNRRHEHTKNYAGTSIQFNFTLKSGTDYYTNASPIAVAGQVANNTGNYRFNFTFVNAALFEVSQQTISLVM